MRETSVQNIVRKKHSIFLGVYDFCEYFAKHLSIHTNLLNGLNNTCLCFQSMGNICMPTAYLVVYENTYLILYQRYFTLNSKLSW